jgi:hypothetical protein
MYANILEVSLKFSLKFGTIGELIFTVAAITGMISPTLFCYFWFAERWSIMLSILMSMVLMVTGYKHLNKIKASVVRQ